MANKVTKTTMDSELEETMGLPIGHFSMIRRKMAAMPAKIRKGLKAKGYPRLKIHGS